jgi:hypothetical protein
LHSFYIRKFSTGFGTAIKDPKTKGTNLSFLYAMPGAEIPIELHPLVQGAEEVDGAREENLQELHESSTKDPVPLSGPLRQTFWSWIIAFITVVSLTATLILARRTLDSGIVLAANPLEEATARLRIVRIMAEINTSLLTALVAMSGKVASWAASSSRAGVSIPLWLSMNPTTGTLGMLKLLLWQSTRKSRTWYHRGWIVMRYRRYFVLKANQERLLIHVAIPVISLLLTSTINCSGDNFLTLYSASNNTISSSYFQL